MMKKLLLTMLVVATGCRPDVRGLCITPEDCRTGAACAIGGICVASSGSCSPACGVGELCNRNVCVDLKPVVRVVVDSSAYLSPSAARVLVHVDAAADIALGALTVSVNSDHLLATGTSASAVVGDNYVTLARFDPAAVGPVSVSASLAFTPRGGSADLARSAFVPALIDAQVPLISSFVQVAPDAVLRDGIGWVPRTADNLEVVATVDDQTGSGADRAELKLDTCLPSSPCVFTGRVLQRPTAKSAVFSFLVPRSVQNPGSEAPVMATISGWDNAGNVGRNPVSLPIDDAGPTFGALTIVGPQGVVGEDKKTWFPGGPSGPTIEVAIPVVDQGVGVLLPGAVAMTLEPSDVTASPPPPAPAAFTTSPPDGTVHFNIPASAVVAREGHLRFTLSARDRLQNATAVPPSDANALWIDDKPPTVQNVRVDYGNVTPSMNAVCGSAATGVICGRDSAHLLRDDVTTVSFEAFDCGSGLGAQASANIAHEAQPVPAALQNPRPSVPACLPGSNTVHTYSFRLDAAAHIPDAPDPTTGTAPLALLANASDLTNHAAVPLPGSASISLWRWKTSLNGGKLATGSPALLPGTAGARQILVGTQGTANNVSLINPDGTQAWTVSLPTAVSGDIAVDAKGLGYAVAGDRNCGSTACGILNIVDPAAKLTTACTSTAQGFGAPASIINLGSAASPVPAAVVAATSAPAAGNNVFLFQFASRTCSSPWQGLLVTGGGNPTGVTAAGIDPASTGVFFSHGAGFTSVLEKSGTSLDTGNPASFSDPKSPTPVAAKDPPGIFAQSPTTLNPIFAGADKLLRRTIPSSGLTAGWMTDSTFAPPALSGNPVGTPVFDGGRIYAMDDQGTLSAWSLASGSPVGKLTSSPAATLTSAPVLLQQSSALLVQQDGLVRVGTITASGASAVSLLKTGAPFPTGTVPPTPVLDVRGTFGVAYVPDGSGLLWAIQTDAPPLAATSSTWPRPGHDSCNTRNALANWCP